MQYTVLHVITRLTNGGAEESVMDTIIEIAKQGVYCDLAIGRELVSNTLEKFPLPEKCTIHRIPHLVRKVSPVYDMRALKELRTLIEKQNYTIVHTHTSKAGILGRFAARCVLAPIVVGSIHGISFPRSAGLMRHVYKYLEKRAAQLSDALVYVGEDIKSIYIQAGIGDAKHYEVIYTGMNLDAFRAVHAAPTEERVKARRRLSLPEDLNTIVLANIGRLQRSKNQRALISMLPKIVQACSSVHVVFIGDGPEEKKLKKHAHSLGMQSYITFAGYVQNIWEVMSACDIHCFMSRRNKGCEGLPRVLVQTSAAGIANISYDAEGVSEIITDGVNGYVIPSHDEKTFVEKMVQLIRNKKIRAQFGKVGTRIADERWSLTKLGTDTKALYEKLLQQKGMLPRDFSGQRGA